MPVRRGACRPVSTSTDGDIQPIDSLPICGAGYLPHRFKQGKGFEQPSVYCKDLWKLISHISSKMADEYKAERFSMSADKQAPTIM